MAERTSFWARTFAEARRRGSWFDVPRRYTRKTAQQIASDIGNHHRREERHQRVRGILPGEVWEARWAPVDDDPHGDHVVQVRLAPSR